MNQVNVEKFMMYFKEILESWENAPEEKTSVDCKGDSVDVFNQEREQTLILKLKKRNSQYVKKVRQALKRIDEGSFGVCQDCGADISEKRLLARPTADLCINCKEDEEKNEAQSVRMANHPSTTNKKVNVIELSKFKEKNQDIIRPKSIEA